MNKGIKIVTMEESALLKKGLKKEFIDKEEVFYNKESLNRLNLTREINYDNLPLIYKAAQDEKNIRKFNNLSQNETIRKFHLDKFVGIHQHAFFKITRQEASRFELWNSIMLQIEEAKEFIIYRKDIEDHDSNKSLITTESELMENNPLSNSWWKTEMSRNGNDYSTSDQTFNLTTNFYDRVLKQNFAHDTVLLIAMITFFNKGNKWKDYIKNLNDEEWPDKREPETIRRNASVFFPRILNEFLASNPIELNSDIDLTIKKDYGNYNKWLSKSDLN